jgi:predicted nucleotide-binding protein (sugar kinase/HSP70/actin superfamily)
VAKESGNERDSKAATRAAMVAEETAAEQTRRTGSPLHVFDSCAMRASRAAEPRLEAHTSAAPRVGVVGHPYLVFDPGLGLGVLDKLRGAGAEPMVAFPSFADIERAAGLPGSPNWFYEVELMTAARHLLDRERVDGLLLVTSFACGTGAVTNELVRKHAVHELGVPTMGLLLDEHTGEAGLITRLESFVDLLRLKRT